MWPSLNETKSMWPTVGNKQGWNASIVHPEYIYEARKGEKARPIAELDVARRQHWKLRSRTAPWNHQAQREREQAVFRFRWLICRHCQIRNSPAKLATGLG